MKTLPDGGGELYRRSEQGGWESFLQYGAADSLTLRPLVVEEAEQACEMSQWHVEAWIDCLAAAYAEAGDFEQAAKYQQQAIDLLGSTQHGLYTPAESKARLELYKSGMPYRETPKAKVPTKWK